MREALDVEIDYLRQVVAAALTDASVGGLADSSLNRLRELYRCDQQMFNVEDERRIRELKKLLADRLATHRRKQAAEETLRSQTGQLRQAYGIECFYHITAVANLPSILTDGLLCHNHAQPARDISDPDIQRARHAKRVPLHPDILLHDCVPLFIAARPPMLYACHDKQHEIAYLHIDPMVLCLPGVVFTDGNARSNQTRFFRDLADLCELDWQLLRAHYWGDPSDEVQHRENKRKRSAEVLVPGRVPANYFQQISVLTQDAVAQVDAFVEDAKKTIPVQSNRELYYTPKGTEVADIPELDADDEIPF